MKVTIVKNTKLETVGFHVESSKGVTIYTQGIAALPSNFTLTVPGDDYEEEIFAIVRAKEQVCAADDMFSIFCAAVDEKAIKVERDSLGTWSIQHSFLDKLINEANVILQHKVELLINKILKW